MIRRLAVVTAAAATLTLLGAPGAGADERLQVGGPTLACVWAFDLGLCVDNPIRKLP
jgi:hypothetical protein